jgi:hypothetical protein
MVDVDNEGVISVAGCHLSTLKNSCKVSFTIEFSNEQEAREYHNMLCASIEVRCLHVHFGPMQLTGVVTAGRMN